MGFQNTIKAQGHIQTTEDQTICMDFMGIILINEFTVLPQIEDHFHQISLNSKQKQTHQICTPIAMFNNWQHLPHPLLIPIYILITYIMSKFLKGSREQLKSRIFSKLNLSTGEDSDSNLDRQSLRENSHDHLDRMMKQTEKRKLSIRKLITSSNPHSELSDQMTQLRWRIDALKNFTRNEKEKMLMAHRTTSLTGKQDDTPQRELTFDELYELQKRKFALLRERRKNKVGDQKYVEMIGNMQLRKEKRKTLSKVKIEDQMRILNEKIEEKVD